MELGEKLKQARLEAGLSQRQLCGEEITRNMLSQIENGAASPSMGTLRYLAARLGKTVSYFLEEDAVTSPNQQTMDRARKAWESGDMSALEEALKDYRHPDPVFDPEYQLLRRLWVLELARQGIRKNQLIYAANLLGDLGPIRDGYCAEALERRRLLLLGKVQPKHRQEICGQLPELDEELLLRAAAAMECGDQKRSEHLLESAENRESSVWNRLRGELYLARKMYQNAADCFLRAEEESADRLELCYRELGNFERAYYYACKQREGM